MTPQFKRVLPLLAAIVLMLMLAPALAREQDHTCQGGHNCNQGESDGTATADADAESRSESESESFSDSTSTATGTGGDATASTGDATASGSTVVTTTTSNRYKEAPRAYAGTASGPKDIDCRTIWGFDFRGATNDGAGGATFGIPGKERKDCKFERQAARAFAKGDLERGWANHCLSPTNLEATIMVARVVHDEQLDTDGAFKRCMRTAQLPSPEVADLEGKSRP